LLQGPSRQGTPLPAEADHQAAGKPARDDMHPRGQADAHHQVVP